MYAEIFETFENGFSMQHATIDYITYVFYVLLSKFT